VGPIALSLQIIATIPHLAPERLKYHCQEALAVKSVPMNNFNVQINAYPNDGNATTTKIVKMARTNKIVPHPNVMPGNFPVNRTNLITPIVFQAIFDVIKKKIVMIIQMNKLAIIAHVKTRMSNVATASAFPKPKNVTDIMIVAMKRTKMDVMALLVICLNLDVPTAKNV
jgi:hypothetical protein